MGIVHDGSRSGAELESASRLHTGVQVTGRNPDGFNYPLAVFALPLGLTRDEFRDIIPAANDAANAFRPAHLFEVRDTRLSGPELLIYVYQEGVFLISQVCANPYYVCPAHNHQIFNLPLKIELAPSLTYGSHRPYTLFSGPNPDGDGNLQLLNSAGNPIGINTQRGSALFNVNARVTRIFPFGKDGRYRVQVFGELYNITDRANFGNVCMAEPSHHALQKVDRIYLGGCGAISNIPVSFKVQLIWMTFLVLNYRADGCSIRSEFVRTRTELSRSIKPERVGASFGRLPDLFLLRFTYFSFDSARHEVRDGGALEARVLGEK